MSDTTAVDNHSATFDHRSEASARDAFELWRHLRDEGPLGYSEQYGGFHVAAGYDEVCAIARDAVTFSSGVTNIPRVPQFFPLINHDPPLHREYRKIVNPLLSPIALAEYVPWVEATTKSIVEPLLALERYDFAQDLALPLAKAFTLHMFKFADTPPDLMQWVDELILGVAGPDAAVAAGKKLKGYLLEQIAARDDDQGSDLLSGLLRGRVNGEPLSEEELIGYSMLLLTAGLETTASGLTATVFYLVQHPEVCEDFVRRPEVRDLAMEEFVRWSSPFTLENRRATADTEVSGCPVKAGDNVLIMWGSANRDERIFDDPDEIVIDRFPNRHVGFGMGPHRCVGSHLAKLVMKAALGLVAPSLGEWRIEDPGSLHWTPAEVRKLHHLPLIRAQEGSA